jgi:dihydroflavonol-4-reductase
LGERYLLCNENLLMSEYFAKITLLTGRPAPKIKPPLWLTLLMAYGFEALSLVTRKDPLIRVCSIKRAMLDLYYDNAKARRELGFAPRPILESLGDEIQWFLDNGYLPASVQLSKHPEPA